MRMIKDVVKKFERERGTVRPRSTLLYNGNHAGRIWRGLDNKVIKRGPRMHDEAR